jgi:hypothetical protein
MQSKMGQTKIQYGGGRHLEKNQLYVTNYRNRKFMVRFCSNFYHSTVLTSSLRKCNRKWDKRKYNMAAAAILKINYTLQLPYLWSDFVQVSTIAPYQPAVFENATGNGINENTRWRRPPS